MKIRRVVSLTMFLSFSVMVYTGIMLFLCPKGRVAYWTGWRLLGLSKEQYGALHTTFMLLLIAAGVWHIVLNWRPIVNYLKTRGRKLRVFTPEFTTALALCLLFTLGTLAGLPPWSSYLQLGESLKAAWEMRDGSPPWGHAEENSLARFARGLEQWERVEHQRRVSLSADDALAALREAGLEVRDEDQRLTDIAHANDTTPQALMDRIRGAARERSGAHATVQSTPPSDGPFPRPMSGLGCMSLRQYSEKYWLDLAGLMSLLGREVDPDLRIREIAGEFGTDPAGLIERLNASALKTRT